jgi:hypothetical protein
MGGCHRRDLSVLQFVAVNASDTFNYVKQGRLLAAANKILDPRNLASLKAVCEDRKWIGGV